MIQLDHLLLIAVLVVVVGSKSIPLDLNSSRSVIDSMKSCDLNYSDYSICSPRSHLEQLFFVNQFQINQFVVIDNFDLRLPDCQTKSGFFLEHRFDIHHIEILYERSVDHYDLITTSQRLKGGHRL